MRKIISILAIAAALYACEEKRDIFEQENQSPIMVVRQDVDGSEYSGLLNDSLYIIEKDKFSAIIKVEDDQYRSSLDFYTDFMEGNGEVVMEDSNLFFIPGSLGMVRFITTIKDPYGLSDKIEINLYVFDNYIPVPSLTFKLLDNNNYQINASRSYDRDGEIINYHFDYGVKTVDWHEPIIEAYYKHIEDNGGVTLVLTDDKGAKEPEVEVVDMKHKSSKKSKKTSSSKMKKKDVEVLKNSLVAIIVVVILAVLIFFIMNKAPEAEPEQDTIAAVLGDEVITIDELNAEYELLPEESRAFIPKRTYLESVMIPQKLLLIQAGDIVDDDVESTYGEYLTRTGMTEEQLEEVLRAQGANIAKFKEMIKMQLFLNKTIYQSIEVTEEEIQDFYDTSKENMVDDDGNVIALEDISEQIRNALLAQKYQIATQEYLQRLQDQTEVEIRLPEDTSDESLTVSAPSEGDTFSATNDELCTEDGKPVIRLFSTTKCPHCAWIKETFDSTIKEYADRGLIVAHHWEFDTGDDTLTDEIETEVPADEVAIYEKYNSRGAVPSYVFGCKYVRIGNGYERENNLEAEKAEFVKLVEELIA